MFRVASRVLNDESLAEAVMHAGRLSGTERPEDVSVAQWYLFFVVIWFFFLMLVCARCAMASEWYRRVDRAKIATLSKTVL